MDIVFALLAGFLIIAAAIGAYVLWRFNGGGVPRTSFAEHCAFIAPHIRIVWPDEAKWGPGPYPLVIQFHGCGGVRTIQGQYARLAASNGVAAAIVDSLTPRGIDYEEALDRVCTGRRLWGRHRAADAMAALALLADNERIDPDRIAAAGWSHGAWTLLDAMTMARDGRRPDGLSDMPDKPLTHLSAVMVFYPFNDFPARSRKRAWLEGVPVEALLVEDDTVATTPVSIRVFERQQGFGADVSWDIVDGVTHGFDEPDHAPHATLRFDQEKTDLARGRYVDFLKRRLRPAPTGG